MTKEEVKHTAIAGGECNDYTLHWIDIAYDLGWAAGHEEGLDKAKEIVTEVFDKQAVKK